MTDRPRTLSLLLLAVAAGAITIPLLGPLVLGVLDYHVSAGASDQIRGGDVAGLLLVAPAALLAAWRVHRDLPGGPALALPPAAYGLYAWSQGTIGDPGRYAGSSERFFPLFAVLVACCGGVLVLAGADVLRSAPPSYSARLRDGCGWYFVAVAAFLLVGLHLPGLVDVWRGQPSAEYLADPVVFWVVKLMDLAYVVPLLTAVGVALLRGRSAVLLAPVAGWCALLGSSVAGMAVVMLATGAAGASLGLAAGMVVAAVAALVLAARAYAPLLTSRSPVGPVTRSPAAPAPA